MHSADRRLCVVEVIAVPGSCLILWQWCHHQQSEAAEECSDDWGQQCIAVLCCFLYRSSSDIRHLIFYMPKTSRPPLMGCSILIWLHKKKIWAFILFGKQHSRFSKAFWVALQETGMQRLFSFVNWHMWLSAKTGLSSCNSVQIFISWSYHDVILHRKLTHASTNNVYLFTNSLTKA